MHICFVTKHYPSKYDSDGIGSYVFQMSQGLIHLGHEVTVICEPSAGLSENFNKGLRIVYCPWDSGDYQKNRIKIAETLDATIKKFAIDIVEFPEFRALGLEFQKRFPRFPVVVKTHGDTLLCRLGDASLPRRIIIKLKNTFSLDVLDSLSLMERESVSRAHAVVSPSQFLMQRDLRLGWRIPKLRFVIPLPFSGWPDEPDWNTKDYNNIKVVSLGVLNLRKGAALMPNIFHRVWREVPEARFVILGQSIKRIDGQEWSDWLINKIPEAMRPLVSIKGRIPYFELSKHLFECSLGFFASTWENFPNTHIECMYSGMACVIGSGGGAQEIGVNGVSCYHVLRNDREIAKYLVQLIKDSNLRKNMGEAARKYVLTQYSQGRITDLTLEVYRKVLQGR